jgi:hypothetical protein
MVAVAFGHAWHFASGSSDRERIHHETGNKLGFSVVLIRVTVFSLRAYDSAQREIGRARADLREGHFIIGRALRPAILEVWRLEGKKIGKASRFSLFMPVVRPAEVAA